MLKYVFPLALLTLPLFGCGGSDVPELGTVYGVVKLDGEPLPNAIVHFSPAAGEGRPSSGQTDDEGYYSLQYTLDYEGAIVGSHNVRLELIVSEDQDNIDEEEDPEAFAKIPQLPASALDGSITKEVKSGSNEINIDVTKD